MEPALMLKTATVLIAITAVGGAAQAGMRFSGAPHPPAWLAMLHGLLAAAGLTLLIYAAVTLAVPATAQYAIGCFVVAALGGALMNLRYHWKNLPLPIPLMLGHAVLAAIGLVLLWMAAF